jgi:hypothetical protein
MRSSLAFAKAALLHQTDGRGSLHAESLRLNTNGEMNWQSRMANLQNGKKRKGPKDQMFSIAETDSGAEFDISATDAIQPAVYFPCHLHPV